MWVAAARVKVAVTMTTATMIDFTVHFPTREDNENEMFCFRYACIHVRV